MAEEAVQRVVLSIGLQCRVIQSITPYLSFKGLVSDLNPRPLLVVLFPEGEDVAQELSIDGGGWRRIPVNIQPGAECGNLAPDEGWRPGRS